LLAPYLTITDACDKASPARPGIDYFHHQT
jgi:hypothetical protein